MTTYLTTLPPAPQRTEPTTFADRADAWVTAIETVFTPEINTIITEINAAAASASSAGTSAANAAISAAAASIDADNAAISASSADTDATNAAISASSADIDATNAAISAAAALVSANNAAAVSGSGNGQFSTIAVDINNGTVDGAVIGGAVPAAGSFTTLSASGGAIVAGSGTDGVLGQVLRMQSSAYPTYGHNWTSTISAVAANNKLKLNVSTGDGTTTEVVEFSPTGLAVTGGITATGALTTNGLKEDASGNLGLGVTPSAWGGSYKVIQNPAGGIGAFSTSSVVYSQNARDSSGWKYLNTGPAGYYNQSAGIHSWGVAPSGTAGAPISFTQAMTLDASGNLNIANLTASKAVFTDASKNLTSTGTLGVAQGGTGVTTLTGIVKASGVANFAAAVAGTDYVTPALGNTNLTGIKNATFNSQITIGTTTGAITIDWSTAQNQKQTEPTGSITYTFTAPAGVCHLQLIIDSDGTSTAQVITWPASVIWLGSTWAGVANKKAIINFWYDGTNYFAISSNQV